MRLFILAIFSICFLVSLAFGQIPDKPSNYITDVADYIQEEQETVLNDSLRSFEDSTTHQIFVLVSDTLGGRDIDELGPALAEQWGVGQVGKDNGVLISLFVKDRQLRIDVGYGLEGDLTDYQTALIRKNTMEPLLREERYGDAVEAGVFEIMKTLRKVEVETPSYHPRYSRSYEKVGFPPVIWGSDNTLNIHFILLIIFLVLEIILCFKLWGKIVNKYRQRLKERWPRMRVLWGSHTIVFICVCVVSIWNSDFYYSVYIVEINNMDLRFFVGVLCFWGMIPLAMWLYKWKKSLENNTVKKGEDKAKVSDTGEVEGWKILELITSFIAHFFYGLVIWLNYGLLAAWLIGEIDPELGAIVGTIAVSAVCSFTFYCFYHYFLHGGPLGGGGTSFSSSGRSSFGSGSFSSGGSSSWGGGGFGGGGGGSFGGGGSSGSW